jgi:hypothetical protein
MRRSELEIERDRHRGLRRRAGVAQMQKSALVDDALRQIVGRSTPKALLETRDRPSFG